MRRLLALLLPVLLVSTAYAKPIPVPVPKSAFPPHTTQLKAGTLSAHNYFCSWEALCEAQVLLLHSLPPDCSVTDVHFSEQRPDNPATCLGRVRGWIEGAVTDNHKPTQASYAILGNSYDSATDAAGSALDFVQTSMNPTNADFSLSKSQPNMLPGTDLGGATVLVFKSGIPQGVNALLTVAFDGTAEVEAGATWLSGSGTQGKVLHELVKLTRLALTYQLALAPVAPVPAVASQGSTAALSPIAR